MAKVQQKPGKIAQKTQKLRESADWAVIGVALKALSFTMMRIAKKDRMMFRAINELDGTYRFENGDGNRHRFLKIGHGKVKTMKNYSGNADFTFTLYEPPVFYARTKPEQVLKIAISNKIGQKGNTYYLFQFGFVMSLIENYFKSRKKSRKKD